MPAAAKRRGPARALSRAARHRSMRGGARVALMPCSPARSAHLSPTRVCASRASASARAAQTIVEGCTNPQALNYDSGANVHVLGCVTPKRGCMDSLADDFKSDANVPHPDSPVRRYARKRQRGRRAARTRAVPRIHAQRA